MLLKFFAAREIPAIFLLAAVLILGGCGRNSAVTAEDTKIAMGTLARLTVRADEITAQTELRSPPLKLRQGRESGGRFHPRSMRR